MSKNLSIVLLLALGATACKKSDGDAAGPSGKATEAAAVKLAKIGLQIDVGGEASVGDGIGDNSQMVTGESIGAMQVELADKKQTIDDAKSDAGMFNPKNLKAEMLADGWALTYDNVGSAGANFFVTVQRDIAGKTYSCSTTASEADRAKAVLAACKSLRK
jgi:hypothetical protein